VAKIELTEEMKHALQGLAPYSPDVPFVFTPGAYMHKRDDGGYIIPEALWPTFTIRQLTKTERDQVRRLLVANAKDQAKVSSVELAEWARKVTRGWSNLLDAASGEDIAFASDKDGSADPTIFDRLPDLTKSAILTRAVAISGLAGVEYLGFGS
jgi:hypothetical protein